MKRFAPGMLVTRNDGHNIIVYSDDPSPASKVSFDKLSPKSVLLVISYGDGNREILRVLTEVGLRWVYTACLKLV